MRDIVLAILGFVLFVVVLAVAAGILLVSTAQMAELFPCIPPDQNVPLNGLLFRF